MQQILILKKLFLLEWSTTNLTKLNITWKCSLSYSKMNKPAFLEILIKIHLGYSTKTSFGEKTIQATAGVPPSAARPVLEQSSKLWFRTHQSAILCSLAAPYTHSARCHSSPSTATRSATLQRAATARAHTQTNRRGNWSRNTVQMNSGQASPGYQTIPTRMPGWFLWRTINNNSLLSALYYHVFGNHQLWHIYWNKCKKSPKIIKQYFVPFNIPDLYYCNYF